MALLGSPVRAAVITLRHLPSAFSPAGNAAMLWCACSTSVFKSATSRFIKNLACSGMCAGLACVPFDVALGAGPRCCWWLHALVVCKAVKFLQKLYCSVTVLSFSAIALDRWATGSWKGSLQRFGGLGSTDEFIDRQMGFWKTERQQLLCAFISILGQNPNTTPGRPQNWGTNTRNCTRPTKYRTYKETREAE